MGNVERHLYRMLCEAQAERDKARAERYEARAERDEARADCADCADAQADRDEALFARNEARAELADVEDGAKDAVRYWRAQCTKAEAERDRLHAAMVNVVHEVGDWVG